MARCNDHRCVFCSADEECAGIAGLEVCQDGVCHECSPTNGSACTGATPFCHGIRLECVECVTSADCTDAEAAHCSDSFQCVPCVADDDCVSVEGLPACDDGECFLCSATSEEECPAARPRCRTSDHSCVECLAVGDCGEIRCGLLECVDWSCFADDDVDDDGSTCLEDCDDDDPDNYPGNEEVCDGRDNDCDGEPEETLGLMLSEERVSAAEDEMLHCSIASGGPVVAVGWCDDRSAPRMAIIEEDGTPIWRGGFGAGTGTCTRVVVAWNGEAFAIVWNASDSIRGAVIGTDGTIVTRPTEIYEAPANSLDLSYNGDDVLGLAWSSRTDSSVSFLSLDTSLRPTLPARDVNYCSAPNPNIAASPSGFLVACTVESEDFWYSVRSQYFSDPDTMYPSRPHRPPADSLAVASAAVWIDGGFVIAWTDEAANTVSTQRLTRFGSLDGDPIHIEVDPEILIIDARMARGAERGGDPGLGLFLRVINEDREEFTALFQLDSRGEVMREGLAVGMLETVFSMGRIEVSDARIGLATCAVESIGSDPHILVSTIESCF